MIEAVFGGHYSVKIELAFKIMGLLPFGRMVKKMMTVMKIGNLARIQILIQMKTLNMMMRT